MSGWRFLIDECLSKALEQVATARGHVAFHVAHRGWSGRSDAWLVSRAAAENAILVTNNRADFLDLYARERIHDGLVVIVPAVSRSDQERLFGLVLDRLEGVDDLINRVLEIRDDCSITVRDLVLP